jgi:integron integrase
LLDQVRERIRVKHYSIRTETQYVQWVRRFILFHGKQHPRDMGAAEVEAFLTHLAIDGHVSASTQNQASPALLFLYKEVLGIDLPWLNDVTRAKRPQRRPVALTREEVRAVLDRMSGTCGLMGRLLYRTGVRLMECVRLRVKDVDFGRCEILIRDGKGAKDRVTTLPLSLSLAGPLRAHLLQRRALFDDDRRIGKAGVYMPDALARKYPNAPTDWGWQYVFPSGSFSVDPRSGEERRHHLDDKPLAACDEKGGAGCGDRQDCDAAYAAPFLRHAPDGGGLRYPHGAGTWATRTWRRR